MCTVLCYSRVAILVVNVTTRNDGTQNITVTATRSYDNADHLAISADVQALCSRGRVEVRRTAAGCQTGGTNEALDRAARFCNNKNYRPPFNEFKFVC